MQTRTYWIINNCWYRSGWSVLFEYTLNSNMLFRPIMIAMLLSCFLKISLSVCVRIKSIAAHIMQYLYIFSTHLLMVLTINSRGCLCLNHPHVIISTDLIFLFSLQSWAGKTWLQDGDVLAADKAIQYLKTLDMDIYISILLVDHTPPE